jgi:hypothetical protein
MAHKVLHGTCSGNNRAEEDSGVVLPSFTFAPFAGRMPLDEVPSDLVLMTKLYRHDIPAALHVSEPSVATLLKTTIQEEFAGKRGEFQLLQSCLPNSQGEPGRHILLIGLGPVNSYNSKTSCRVFEILFEQALELGATSVLVPFIPNPMTKESLTHKATAFKMKHVLTRVLREWKGPVSLTEVKFYCSPAAVRHIQQGLQINAGDGCPCANPRS